MHVLPGLIGQPWIAAVVRAVDAIETVLWHVLQAVVDRRRGDLFAPGPPRTSRSRGNGNSGRDFHSAAPHVQLTFPQSDPRENLTPEFVVY